MGLIRRLDRLTAASVEAALAEAPEPRRALDELLSEIDDEWPALVRAERKAREALAASQRRLDQITGRILRLARGAELAVRLGQEDLAREALAEQFRQEGELSRCEREVAAGETAAENTRAAIARLEDIRADLLRRRRGLGAPGGGAGHPTPTLLPSIDERLRRLEREAEVEARLSLLRARYGKDRQEPTP